MRVSDYLIHILRRVLKYTVLFLPFLAQCHGYCIYNYIPPCAGHKNDAHENSPRVNPLISLETILLLNASVYFTSLTTSSSNIGITSRPRDAPNPCVD